MRAEGLAVLLIKRGNAPFKGRWALPGGFVNGDEGLEMAAARQLQDETGIAGVGMEQLGAFGDPGRDPRGHTVSVAYLAFVVAESRPIFAGDDAAEVAWVPLRALLPADEKAKAKRPKRAPVQRGKRAAIHELAFDHGQIIARARVRLQERMNDPMGNEALELVPPRFTLTELQRVYEAVFGHTFDKRNFRTRMLARQLVEPVGASRRLGRHRPAQLYRWKQPKARPTASYERPSSPRGRPAQAKKTAARGVAE